MAWSTHEIRNQYDALSAYPLLETDLALQEALARAQAGWAMPMLQGFSAELARPETWAWAEEANRHTPELHAFDARGRRVDQVEYHPSWQALMALYRRQGLVSLAFDNDRPGRWAATAAGFYLHGQVEAGTLCPATMTQAAIPVLQKEPALWAEVGPHLLNTRHDPRDVPLAQKAAGWIGMGMTEKQGGSDVRANTTQATPVGAGGRGAEYRLTGHKWFFSVPTSDAHLVVARTPEGGHSCFYVPRWRPDGTRNAVQIQRLKEKVGNRSNASSEVEFQDAFGLMLGDEGRGIPTIIEMATYTRLNCVLGSSAILRQAAVQAIAYTRQRHAFGRALAEQPLMRAVLADLVLESEAALVLAMRLAQAFEAGDTPAQKPWKRLLTPAAKFWVCKRAVELTGEAMEVFGGNGYVDEGPMARLFREAPVNSIWEGSGNVMCLDVMRAVAREPDAAWALLDELGGLAAGEPRLIAALQALGDALREPPEALEGLGRRFAQQLVLVAQAGLLRQHAPAAVSGAFIATRFGDGQWGRVVGALDTRGLDVNALLQRAYPA
ncbi:acyl-CoA dehydrogenase family protein [Ideonella azotifigens]|uniref:Acyl-CoA dehydrogenase family protein n=2 Tax=Ideonella azotifigens TaxID=513160 RepID=A0ABN1JMB8_9BURK|nr:acyl-CoA dehydrogenase family protein [Ideonella azotifigens]MCD2339818.1 acyl-CoA dehydrogenase family protein [Ideonella azotifigens]